MIWLVFGAMTAAALAAFLWPLWRVRTTTDAPDAHLAIYRAQLDEIDRDVAGGSLALPEAQSARTEAARRLLAERDTALPFSGSSSRRAVAAMVAIATCAAAVLLYASIGSPELPDAPISARATSPQEMDFAAAMARIEAHLAKEPDDLRGWTVIAPVYLRTGRGDDAVRAYGAILRLGGDTADHHADYGEAQVYATQGMITAAARREFDAALSQDPRQAKARFYLGLAAEQDGESAKARTIWTALAAEQPPGSPLATLLARHLADRGLADAPASETGQAIAALPADAQQAAIRGMVERLASRLQENGADIEGWLRLVRAYRVLGDNGKARDALADARRSLARDDAAKTRLDALARELGLEG